MNKDNNYDIFENCEPLRAIKSYDGIMEMEAKIKGISIDELKKEYAQPWNQKGFIDFFPSDFLRNE